MYKLENREGFNYGSISFPRSGEIAIGQELVDVDIETLKKEVEMFGYGDRVNLVEVELAPVEPGQPKKSRRRSQNDPLS